MLEYGDFYRIADYANIVWKGGYSPIEIAENAYNYLRDFEWSKANGKVANSIKTLLSNLDADIENGEELEDVKYWTSEIRKELGLNQPIYPDKTKANFIDAVCESAKTMPSGTKIIFYIP